jgi:hypothetical protein
VSQDAVPLVRFQTFAATQLKDKEMKALLEKMDPKQAVAWAARGEMVWSTRHRLNPFRVEHRLLNDFGVSSLQGGLTIGKDVTGQMTLVAKDADVAKAILTATEGALQRVQSDFQKEVNKRKDLAPVLESVQSIKVSAKGSTITFQGSGGAIAKAILLLLERAAPARRGLGFEQ